MCIKDRQDSPRGRGRLTGCFNDAGEEELEPRLPLALGPRPVKLVVFSGGVHLEIKTQVEDRLALANGFELGRRLLTIRYRAAVRAGKGSKSEKRT